jgi:hypothetical protein
MAGHVQKQPAPSPSQKSPWAPEKSKREYGTLERVEKKKQKPKTAPAGGGAKPPSKPPKGPTGGDNKGPKDYSKGHYGEDKHSPSMGKVKGVPNKSKGEDLKKDKQFFSKNNSPMNGLKKATKKDK